MNANSFPRPSSPPSLELIITDLPPELLELIASFLGWLERVNLSKACRRLKGVLSDVALRRLPVDLQLDPHRIALAITNMNADYSFNMQTKTALLEYGLIMGRASLVYAMVCNLQFAVRDQFRIVLNSTMNDSSAGGIFKRLIYYIIPISCKPTCNTCWNNRVQCTDVISLEFSRCFVVENALVMLLILIEHFKEFSAIYLTKSVAQHVFVLIANKGTPGQFAEAWAMYAKYGLAPTLCARLACMCFASAFGRDPTLALQFGRAFNAGSAEKWAVCLAFEQGWSHLSNSYWL